jgi:hypothetical protein
VLIEQVIPALPLNQAIGIIQPVGFRQKVIAGAMKIVINHAVPHRPDRDSGS